MNNIDFEQRKKDLQELQQMSLSDKIQNTMAKLMEFYDGVNGNCYISCSGGADSIVLYDIAKRFVEDISPRYKFKVVFDDTGLEEPTVRATALAIPDVQVVKPEMPFIKVLTEIGYPLVSKEVSECVNNARLHLSGGGYARHFRKICGLGEFAAESSKNSRDTSESKGYP